MGIGSTAFPWRKQKSAVACVNQRIKLQMSEIILGHFYLPLKPKKTNNNDNNNNKEMIINNNNI